MKILLDNEKDITIQKDNSLEKVNIKNYDDAIVSYFVKFENSEQIIQIRQLNLEIKVFCFKDVLALENFDFEHWQNSKIIKTI